MRYLAGVVGLQFREGMGFYPAVLFVGFLQQNIVAVVYIHVGLCNEHTIPAVTKSHNTAT
jgi:hypothetical protein